MSCCFFFFFPCYSFLWFIFNPHLLLEQQIDLVNLQVHRPWDQLTWVLPLLKPSDTADKWYSVMRRICQAYSALFMKIERLPRKYTQIPETPSKHLHLKWKFVKPLSLLSLEALIFIHVKNLILLCPFVAMPGIAWEFTKGSCKLNLMSK